MSFFRSFTFAALLYGSLVLLGIVWLPALFMPRSVTLTGIRIWARIARWGMRNIVGADSEIRGLGNMPPEPVIIASKHQSMIDTLLPFLFLKDPCFILKQELMYYPIFGLYAAKARMIAIDRAGSTKALKDMTRQAKAAMDEGRSLVIFPEGTRLRPDEKVDLKPGIAFLYKELNRPCVPVVLNTGYCWPAKGIQRYAGKMVMEILPAIEPGLNRKAFMRTLSDAFENGTAPLLTEGRKSRPDMVETIG